MQHEVAVVGFGAVGKQVAQVFPGAVTHDPPLGMNDVAAVNSSRFAFVCVPTPSNADGSCDVSVVEGAVAWIESEIIIIRSTVPPGTTDRLAREYGKRVVFQPEYGPGETPDHPYRDARSLGWVILGGPREWTGPVCDLYKRVFNSQFALHQTDARTAELTKYMENAFLAAKVAFCNEFYDVAGAMGVDFNELRELWLLDERIGRSHTWVHPDDRGFGGKCLPKDLNAIIAASETAGYPAPLLKAVDAYNGALRGR